MGKPYRIEGRFEPVSDSLVTTPNSHVWQGVDHSTDDRVAIKRPLDPSGHDVVRLRREATALALTGHQGVAPLVSQGEDRDGLYLITRWIDGQTFPVGMIPADRLVTLGRELLHHLVGVHDLGFVHRDLKPGNVLVGDDDQVWLLDFGVVYSPDRFSPIAHDSRLGTLRYMAPEQLDRQPVDERTDLYAVGLLLFEALCGHHPFEGLGPAARLEDPAPAVRTLVPGAPADLADLVDRLLERSPDSRPRSAREALARIEVKREPFRLARFRDDLGTLSVRELEELFEGPDRVLHEREDPARELYRRTGGHARSVERLLGEWSTVEGVERLEDGRIHVPRSRLRSCTSRPTPFLESFPGWSPTNEQAEALRFIALAGGTLDRGRLAIVSGQGEATDDVVDEVVGRRLAIEDDGCLHVTLTGASLAATWSDEQFAEAHQTLAAVSEPCSWVRLLHGIAGSLVDVIDGEVIGFAANCRRRGQFELACHALQTVLARYGATLDAERRVQLLVHLVCASYATESPDHRGTAQRLCRQSEIAPSHLQTLADASVAHAHRDFTSQRHRLEAIGPLEDEELEVLRVALSVEAHQRDLATWRAVLDAHEDWSELQPRRRALWSTWSGLHAYGRRDYASSMRWHREARSALRGDAYLRLVQMVHEAISAAERPETSELAIEVAHAAVGLAADLRLPGPELRAWTVIRSVAYRKGSARRFDAELVEAARRVDIPRATAHHLFVEGVIAWRVDEAAAESILVDAKARSRGNASLERLCDALLTRIRRGPIGPAAAEVWCERLGEEPNVFFEAQLWTLLSSMGLDLGPAPTLTDGFMEDNLDWRLEVLSTREIRAGSTFVGPEE